MIKFEVIEEDVHTKARAGILKINGKTVRTPLLWLGCYIGAKPHPWKLFKVDGILVNACEIIKKRLAIKPIHQVLGTDSLVMMDSGGFQLIRRRASITPSQILEIYRRCKPDIGVVLDYPFDPSSLGERKEKWTKTLENTKFMLENSYDIVLMPVVHGYTLRELKMACEEIKEIAEPKLIGIGSLVPVIKHMKTSKLSRLNKISGIKFIAEAISLVRKEFPDSMLHVFGIGSVSTMHLMFALGVDSVDSAAWRIKAAYGAIQLPGVGDRFISPKSSKRKGLEPKEIKLLEVCDCPICKGKTLAERKMLLDNSNKDTFYNRAIHNAYVFKKEEHMFKEAIRTGTVLKFIEERLRGTRYDAVAKSLLKRDCSLLSFM